MASVLFSSILSNLGFPGGGSSLGILVALAADTSSEWYSKSTHYIKSSVSAVYEKTGRVFLAESGIGSSKAMFSNDPHLYEFQDDPVSHIRKMGCDDDSDLICLQANTGHPNSKGAHRYAQRMKEIADTWETPVVATCGSQPVVDAPRPMPELSDLSISSFEVLDKPTSRTEFAVPAFEHVTIRLFGTGFWRDDEVFFLSTNNNGESCETAYDKEQSIERSSIDLVDDGNTFADVSIKFNAADTFVLCYAQNRGTSTSYHRKVEFLTIDVDLPRSLELDTTVVTRTVDPQKAKVVLPFGIRTLDSLWLAPLAKNECRMEDAEGKMFQDEIPVDRTIIMELPLSEEDETAITTVRVCAVYGMQTIYTSATISNQVVSLGCPDQVTSADRCTTICDADEMIMDSSFEVDEPVTSCPNVCACTPVIANRNLLQKNESNQHSTAPASPLDWLTLLAAACLILAQLFLVY